MKILLASHLFHPSTGGIEVMSWLLAEEFVKQGHSVKVVTQIPHDQAEDFPFEIVRQPSSRQLLQLVRWCDVYFHNNISLQMIWPLLVLRRPWVVAHRTWIARTNGRLGWQDRLKQFVVRFATCISISQAVADHLSTPSVVIGNPYRNHVFVEMPDVQRDKEIIFLGRLVSDKGADILMEALALLKQKGVLPQLTVVGSGPEMTSLQALAVTHGVAERVDFVGRQTGEELVRLLNAHQIMVVPSRWNEPFGIVALEGIACGCVVVGSQGGGLPEAIGPCGVTFPNNDVAALAQVLRELLCDPGTMAQYRKNAPAHLSKHKAEAVATAYLAVLQDAVLSHAPKSRSRKVSAS